MKPTKKATYALIILMTIVTIAANFCVGQIYGDENSLKKVIPFISVFFALFGTLTINILDSLRGDARKYMNAFMVLKGLKLFSALIGGAIYVVFNRESAVPFLIIFLVYYVIYLVFEVAISQKLNKGLTK